METTLYRIVQEALTNIARHAGASRVSVLLVRRPGSVSALVEDDGHGFGPDAETRGGIGLSGMRERLALVDGRLTIESGRATGTASWRRCRSRDSIVVVDDHAVVRAGLRLLLEAEDDLEVVGDAGNTRDAVFEVRSSKPDVILLDVVMPDESGIDALPKLLHEAPAVRVLILSMQDDPSYVREAFAAGASGCSEGSRRCGSGRHRRPRGRGQGTNTPSGARRAHGRGRGESGCSRRRPSILSDHDAK